MLSSFKNLKNRFKNSETWGEFFASYLTGRDNIYKKLNEAKTDKAKLVIYEELAQYQQNQIEELVRENERLREQIKDKEETESIISGSGSLDGSINSQRQKERQRIIKKIQTAKTSTASERKMLKYLDDIERLENRVKELEHNQNLFNLKGKVIKLKLSIDGACELLIKNYPKNNYMTDIDNEATIKELEEVIDECDTQITALLAEVDKLKQKRKDAEDKLKDKTDKETKTSEALKATKSKAELLREKIKKAQQELKAEIETPPK